LVSGFFQGPFDRGCVVFFGVGENDDLHFEFSFLSKNALQNEEGPPPIFVTAAVVTV
jgi:hypothetical protein